MDGLIHRMASLKIAIVLLVLIIIALAGATIVESTKSSEVALRSVYHALWFRVLLGLLALNVAASLIERWPWGLRRTGFALTHGSMLVILVGAFVTETFKVEGHLALWEGESKASIETPPDGALVELPFTVRLDSFEIDYYQGTRRPAMFRSRVHVDDPQSGESFPAVIEMNRELAHGGFRFFQSSYRQEGGREMTVLAVSKDPGQAIVFTGYCLLVVGMITVLATRVAQRRALARPGSQAAAQNSRRAAAIFVGLGLALALSVPARAESAWVPEAPLVEQLRDLPVQHDGRVMPLDTLAREALWEVSGSDRYGDHEPMAVILGWTLDPVGWAEQPIISLGSSELAVAVGLPAKASHAAYLELAGNSKLVRLANGVRGASAMDRPLTPLQEDTSELHERMAWVQRFFQQTAFHVLPPPDDPAGTWLQPRKILTADDLLAIQESGDGLVGTTDELLSMEVSYNQVRSTRVAWWILAAAAVASLLAWLKPRLWLDVLSVAGMFSAFVVMSWGIAVRWQVAGRIPASNMYESLLFLGWGVGLFALIAFAVTRSRMLVFNATAMSLLTMALVDLLPIDRFIHPMPPVLSGTPWLAIHVPIIMISYSVLAIGVLVAHIQLGVGMVAPRKVDLMDRLHDSLYWYIHIGSILLIAGILTGSIWAASSWGRYWGWDPKEVWSLVAFLAYIAILHGRLERFIGRFGVAVLSIVAFWTILMTYVGVNYVLAAGLHSYGFGGSGVVRALLLVGTVELLFIGAAVIRRRPESMTTIAQPT